MLSTVFDDNLAEWISSKIHQSFKGKNEILALSCLYLRQKVITERTLGEKESIIRTKTHPSFEFATSSLHEEFFSKTSERKNGIRQLYQHIFSRRNLREMMTLYNGKKGVLPCKLTSKKY